VPVVVEPKSGFCAGAPDAGGVEALWFAVLPNSPPEVLAGAAPNVDPPPAVGCCAPNRPPVLGAVPPKRDDVPPDDALDAPKLNFGGCAIVKVWRVRGELLERG
jgi:hypothetical protein